MNSKSGICRMAAFFTGVTFLLTASTARAQKLEAVKEQQFTHNDFAGVGLKRLMFSADGKLLATAGYHSIRVWDLAGDEPKETARATKIAFGPSGLWSMAMSLDGRQIAAGGGDHRLRLFDVAGGKLTERAAKKDQSGTVRSLAFSPDGKLLASGSDDRTIWLYDLSGGIPKEQNVFKPEKAGSAMLSLQFLPDSKRVLFAYQGGKQNIGIADIASKEPAELASITDNRVYRAALSADTRLLAYFSDKDVKVYDFDGSSFKKRHVLKGHKKQGMAVAFSPDGTLLASAGKDATCIVWDVANGKKLLSKLRSGDIEDVAFSPVPPASGQYLLAMPTHERKVYLYTLRK